MILFSDFDDTLYIHSDSHAEIFHKNLEAIQKFRAAGNQFCIITGRELASLKSNLPNPATYCDYIILNNGSVCIDQNEQVIFTLPMKEREVRGLINHLILKSHFSKAKPVYYYGFGSGENTKEDTTKIRIWVESNELAKAQSAEISSRFSDAFQVFTYQNMQPQRSWIPESYEAFSEVISARAGKEAAVAKLTAILNFPSSEIITIGDDWNDLKMLQEFNGYIIANSKPEVLSQVTPSHVIPSVVELVNNLLK